MSPVSARGRGEVGASADVVVVGGGIVGLAVARQILLEHEDVRLVVLEKEDRLAAHQTSHNSGVVHTGIYYEPGSLKARLCVEGSRELFSYCDEQGISYERCGKLIVATREDELPRLHELYRRAQANGVEDVELVGEERLVELEPNVRGILALYSPRTGMVDFRRIAQALADDVVRLGGDIRTRAAVRGIDTSPEGAVLHTGAARVHGRAVISCGGLHADRLAAMTGAPTSPRIVPFRGTYHSLRERARRLVRGHVYPVPDPLFPFLGVHFTRQLSGDVWTGPNAVLAFAREGYRARDVDVRDLWETLSYPGFRSLASQFWRVGLTDVRGELSKRAYVRGLQRLVPAVRASDLAQSHSGVRAQALLDDGRLLDDFWIDRADNVVHVRNAPSPAATSSLALAREIARLAAPLLAG